MGGDIESRITDIVNEMRSSVVSIITTRLMVDEWLNAAPVRGGIGTGFLLIMSMWLLQTTSCKTPRN
ncbi:hypothetical protein [Vulcanisaeta souniana]|uniref:hypothetical protein n=1 Tax=Vulcanisaeta souniana TaxID=164452 RepID=UPI001FB23930|nr:hypothetical protein [Vulcanisaeta souniana]